MKLRLFTLAVLFFVSCEKKDTDIVNVDDVNPLAYEDSLVGSYSMSVHLIFYRYQSTVPVDTYYNDQVVIEKIRDSVLLIKSSSMSKQVTLYKLTDSVCEYTNSNIATYGTNAWFYYQFTDDSIIVSDRNGGHSFVPEFYYNGKRVK